MSRNVLAFLSALLFTGCVRWAPPLMSPVAPGSCRSSTLQWFSPDDARERARLDAWCSGVGGAVIHGVAAGAMADTATRSDIVFVSWNVHVGRGDIRAFVNDLRAGIHTEGRRFPHYVLLLQEVVRTGEVPGFPEGASGAGRIAPYDSLATRDIVSLSTELGTSLIYVPSMRNGKSADPAEDRGSAILSTVPLSAPIAAELPGERQRRVLILAQAASVSVAVVHLDALGGSGRLRLFWTSWMRDVQVRAAASVLPDGPLVVGADLNTWLGRDEQAARYLNQVFRLTPLSIDRQGFGLRVLDYMYFRGGPGEHGRYRQVERRYGSDHRPLVGWIK